MGKRVSDKRVSANKGVVMSQILDRAVTLWLSIHQSDLNNYNYDRSKRSDPRALTRATNAVLAAPAVPSLYEVFVPHKQWSFGADNAGVLYDV
ncbi:unnamed protein product [Arctogadus glacialis]